MENTLIPHIPNTIDPALSLNSFEANSFLVRDHTQALAINSPFNAVLKRSVDIFVSVIVVALLLSWLIPLLAIVVKLTSRGPVFFIQKRNSKHGKIFSCIKLRTMHQNPDADTLAAQENDTRITKAG